MKITSANGKTKISMSPQEWKAIGDQKGWKFAKTTKTAETPHVGTFFSNIAHELKALTIKAPNIKVELEGLSRKCEEYAQIASRVQGGEISDSPSGSSIPQSNQSHQRWEGNKGYKGTPFP